MTIAKPAPGTADEPVPRQLGFDPNGTVDVRQVDDTFWMTLSPLTYGGQTQEFSVPAAEKTDFASVPRVFVWFLPRYGRYTRAAILHDYLWRVEVPAGRISRIDADGVFRRAMRELGVPFLRRWIMWAAVRWGALTKSDGRKGWWREAWRVVLVTLVALPIVAPAAALILITILVFHAVEFLVWFPIELNRRLRKARRRPAKKVNKPVLRLKL